MLAERQLAGKVKCEGRAEDRNVNCSDYSWHIAHFVGLKSCGRMEVCWRPVMENSL